MAIWGAGGCAFSPQAANAIREINARKFNWVITHLYVKNEIQKAACESKFRSDQSRTILRRRLAPTEGIAPAAQFVANPTKPVRTFIYRRKLKPLKDLFSFLFN
jgi:hypothetical protein